MESRLVLGSSDRGAFICSSPTHAVFINPAIYSGFCFIKGAYFSSRKLLLDNLYFTLSFSKLWVILKVEIMNEDKKIMLEELSKKEAIKYLDISDKAFENYFKFSQEIKGYKKSNGRWYFSKEYLDNWKELKQDRTINLSMDEYEKSFEFAIKMVYGGLSLHGIRGERTEVQAADDVILGILAEHAVKKFLKEKFGVEIMLDEEVHPEHITPQDFDLIKKKGSFRKPNLGVGIKASKMKNAFLVLGANEVELPERKSDVYIFARVGLPSDHLFRILRDHSFFGRVRKFFDENEKFKKIAELENIPVWICGFTYIDELERAKSIPGQEFTNGYRYVKNVRIMHNSDDEWRGLIKKL